MNKSKSQVFKNLGDNIFKGNSCYHGYFSQNTFHKKEISEEIYKNSFLIKLKIKEGSSPITVIIISHIF